MEDPNNNLINNINNENTEKLDNVNQNISINTNSQNLNNNQNEFRNNLSSNNNINNNDRRIRRGYDYSSDINQQRNAPPLNNPFGMIEMAPIYNQGFNMSVEEHYDQIINLLHRIADNREIGMINLSVLILEISFFAYLTYVFAEADGFKYSSSLSLYLMICIVFISIIILHLRDV